MSKKRVSNEIGITMIEMMIAIVIAGIIMGTISSFIMVHMKSYEVTQQLVSIQYDSQIVLNQIAEIAMESQGLEALEVAGVSQLLEDDIVAPTILSFKEDLGAYYIFFNYASKPYELRFLKSVDKTAYDSDIIVIKDTSADPIGEVIARNVKLYCVPGKGSLSGALSGGETFQGSYSLEIILRIGKSLDAISLVADGYENTAKDVLEFKTLVTYRNKP